MANRVGLASVLNYNKGEWGDWNISDAICWKHLAAQLATVAIIAAAVEATQHTFLP